MSAIIYHNPRCSKSRRAIEILDENHISYEIYSYLDKGLTKEVILELSEKLGKDISEFIRKKEDAYKELELSLKNKNDFINALVKNPRLLERPIVVLGDKAVIGRPPEDILSLFSDN